MNTTPHLAAELKDLKSRFRYVVMQDLTPASTLGVPLFVYRPQSPLSRGDEMQGSEQSRYWYFSRPAKGELEGVLWVLRDLGVLYSVRPALIINKQT